MSGRGAGHLGELVRGDLGLVTRDALMNRCLLDGGRHRRRSRADISRRVGRAWVAVKGMTDTVEVYAEIACGSTDVATILVDEVTR
ncbi:MULTISPECIES: hypothetical protein [Mycobacteroides]|uniref:hypothetical protein n=1 Tax=Mycobacteroides TaxID=670516 RepID=UPI00103C0EEA|nr:MULTISPECIES: hypothetical protein [Mycobacteroides]WJR34126.1 hypothetical protein P3F83_01345 [Mycobacteroides immunogenum]